MNFFEHQIVPIEQLIPYALNSRTHSDAQVAQLAASIREFGFTNPVLIDEENNLIAGHGRVLAARKLNMDEVPSIVVTGLDDRKRRALIISDNKLGLNSGWDEEALRIELTDLAADYGDLMGFTDTELVDILTEKTKGKTDEDEVPELEEKPISKQGDVFILGNHRLMCGDSTNQGDVEKLMDKQLCDLVWTDPPYNVAIEGAAGKIMNDDMADSEFAGFLGKVYGCYFKAMKPGAVIYVAHADSERVNFTDQFVKSGLKMSQILIWAKNSGTLSRQDFNWQHEPIIYGWKEGAGHYFCGDFTRTTVIDDEPDPREMDKDELVEYCINLRKAHPCTVVREDRPTRSDLHPTMKPVALVERMIEWSSSKGQVVLDLFGGSGSTMIAAEKCGRHSRLMELDPRFTDVIIKRWQEFTGRQAKHENGKTFEELQSERRRKK